MACRRRDGGLKHLQLYQVSLVLRPSPSFPLLAVRLTVREAGEGPGNEAGEGPGNEAGGGLDLGTRLISSNNALLSQPLSKSVFIKPH